MDHSIPTLKVVNVVGVAKVGERLNLDIIFGSIPGAKYDRKVFPGLFWKDPETGVTMLLFRSGKVRITGAESAEEAATALAHLLDALRLLGQDVDRQARVQVVNVVGTTDLGAEIDLGKAMATLAAEYEPEQFPGLIIHLPDRRRTCLLFATGKCTVVGGRSEAELRDALSAILAELQRAGVLR